MLLLGAELIFANLPPDAELFWSLENVVTLASSNACNYISVRDKEEM